VLNLGGSCTPVGLHKAIKTLIQDDNLDPNKWELVLKWCLVAQHADLKDAASSCLAQTFTTVTTKVEMFQMFCTAWIDLILGLRNNMPHSHIANATTPTQNPQVNIYSLVNDMARIIISAQGTPTSATSSTKGKGRDYSEDQVAMIMGLACVMDPNQVPPIWKKCFTQTKNLDVMRFHLKDQTLQWVAKNRCIINGAVNIPEQLLTDIATLRFNLGGSLTDSTWVGRGLTIMCSLPYKPGAWDDILAEEVAARATAATRNLVE
jgi:hypothetical protein